VFVRGTPELATAQHWTAEHGTRPLGAAGPGWLVGPPSPDGERVVVIQVRDATQQLLLVDLQSGAAHPLGPPARRLRQPSWTPDGRQVVVERASDGAPQIWMHPAGGGPGRPLTAHPTGAFDGCVSPDGATLAFVAHAAGSLELWHAPLAGGPAARLLQAEGDDLQPTWSPDGTRLAFLAERGGRLAVHSIARDGSGERTTWRPAPEAGEVLVPEQGLAWSPSGDALAVVVRRADGRPDVRLIDARRGRVLTHAGGLDSAETPAWIPDGTGVVLAGTRGGTSGLHRLSRDGTITPLPTGPGWLPRVLPVEPGSP
jgi:TolB protein